MTILIENLQNKIAVDDNINGLIHRAVETSFQTEDFKIPSEVSILLADNEEIREINKEHRNIDKPTDVLSFPMVDMTNGEINSNEGDYDLDENLLLLGDVVISLEMAKSQAQVYGHSFERELAFLVTHGVFHLLGYDHESEDDEKRMMEKQEAVLQIMGLTHEK
jgi:probable rRNA maturation factor